jgi:ribosomal protein L37AE/L43A
MREIPRTAAVCVCCRVGDPRWRETPGFQQRACYNCGHPINVSAASEAISRKQEQVFVCAECLRDFKRPMMLLPPTPAQGVERPDRRGDIPTRERFIEAYVRLYSKVGQQDTPELRKRAGEVYDTMLDDSTVADCKFVATHRRLKSIS